MFIFPRMLNLWSLYVTQSDKKQILRNKIYGRFRYNLFNSKHYFKAIQVTNSSKMSLILSFFDSISILRNIKSLNR